MKLIVLPFSFYRYTSIFLGLLPESYLNVIFYRILQAYFVHFLYQGVSLVHVNMHFMFAQKDISKLVINCGLNHELFIITSVDFPGTFIHQSFQCLLHNKCVICCMLECNSHSLSIQHSCNYKFSIAPVDNTLSLRCDPLGANTSHGLLAL